MKIYNCGESSLIMPPFNQQTFSCAMFYSIYYVYRMTKIKNFYRLSTKTIQMEMSIAIEKQNLYYYQFSIINCQLIKEDYYEKI